jgi:hypothetical protein
MAITLLILALTLFVAAPVVYGFTDIFVQYYLDGNVRSKDRILVYVLCLLVMFVGSIVFANLLAISDRIPLYQRDGIAVKAYLISILPSLIAVRLRLGRA